jgi:hypothetical protein
MAKWNLIYQRDSFVITIAAITIDRFSSPYILHTSNPLLWSLISTLGFAGAATFFGTALYVYKNRSRSSTVQ